MAIYGVLFFFMNEFYYNFPQNLRLLQQATYTFLEYSTFAYILWFNIDNKKFRKIILYISVCFAFFIIIFFLTTQLGRIDSIPVGVETILIFLYCFFYFYQVFKTSLNQYIYNDPNFLLVVGILLYLGTSFFFNILTNSIPDDLNNYWYLTYIPEIIKNILFAIAIYKYSGGVNEKNRKNSNTVPYLEMS